MERLADARRRADRCPLGAGALAGTTFPIDRRRSAELLGFSAPTENAMDSVADRDYIIEFLSCAAIFMTHASRLTEEIVYWSSSEFGYVALADGFCTGSSMMPQKKNPDTAELIRGKTGRVYGDLVAMLTVMKGTPMAYNKDFQEDKEPLFDAADTWEKSARVLAAMIGGMRFKAENISRSLESGFLAATDIADALTRQGISFREAHGIVGRMVKLCESRNEGFESLTRDDMTSIDPRMAKFEMPDISLEGVARARKSFGGTAPGEVRRQIRAGREWLKNFMKKI
jgi:argininosuccinate lyase